jgi:hypothetical protein
VYASLARIHRRAGRAACPETHADEQVRVATALLVLSWIRASISAYPSRSAIWRKVFAIAFARIHAVRRPDSCQNRLRFRGTEGNDPIKTVGDTRRFAAH